MAEKPYLSEVIDVSKFKRGQANLIIAPCHSGKTTAALDKIAGLASEPERVLYLIDTTAGQDMLLQRCETAKYTDRWRRDIKWRSTREADDEWWGDYFCKPGIRVMTYHLFGIILKLHPEFIKDVQVLICDEMQNLVKFRNIELAKSKWDYKNVGDCQTALNTISEICNDETNETLVTIITATEKAVSCELDIRNVNVEYFDFTDKVYSDSTVKRIYYSNLESVIDEIEDDQKTIIYLPTISLIKQFSNYADNGKRKICCLWSIHNEDYPMSEEQLEVRKTLMKTQRIPDDIDMLFINAAYETSINILNEDIQTVVVHSSNPDTQIQARGRIRHDIEKLYIYDREHEHVVEYFPTEYYGRVLYKEDRDYIVETMNLKDKKGKQYKWPSIRNALEHDGVKVSRIKKNGKRVCVLYPPA